MIFEKVQDIIATQLNIEKEKITMDSDIQNDLNADSIDAVEIIMAIEDEFEIEFPDEELEKMKLISDLVVFIENNSAETE